MREAVIVSTARTPIGRAYRGAFNNTEAPTLAAHSLRHAVERAGIEPGEIDDVIMGCAQPKAPSPTTWAECRCWQLDSPQPFLA